jgi:hypothetical protein
VTVPDSAPPFDDEHRRPGDGAAGRAGTAGPAARDLAARAGPGLATQLPGRAAVPASRPAKPGRPGHPGSDRPGQAARVAPAAGTMWPAQFAQALAETLAGARPPRQIVPWTTAETRRRIRELAPLLSAAGPPRVRRVLAAQPVPGVLEMTILVRAGERTRAVAVRVERAIQRDRMAAARTGPPARWLCTAIEAA